MIPKQLVITRYQRPKYTSTFSDNIWLTRYIFSPLLKIFNNILKCYDSIKIRNVNRVCFSMCIYARDEYLGIRMQQFQMF